LSFRGMARLDKKTKDLVKRIRSTDVAVIDHQDIDQVSAESLIETGVEVVINADKSSSGRYPNTGPFLLCSAGIHLVDNVGKKIFDQLDEGSMIEIDHGKILRDGKVIASGDVKNLMIIKDELDRSKATISDEIEKFAINTLDYVKRERQLILETPDMPDVSIEIAGRHVLVVVRGYDYKADLQTLKPYIKEMNPVLIGVDGGADALRAEGFKADIIIGDMDSVSDETLKLGSELIVHGYMNGRAPGQHRLEKLGLESEIFKAACTSEDLAMLLSYELGAELIVAVGTHGHLVEFLDKGREGMSSTFLVRLKVGDRLVDAKGVNQLYRASPRYSYLLGMILAALTTVTVVILTAPVVRLYLRTVVLKFRLMLGF